MNLGSTSEPKLRDRLREATRAAILDAAEAVFATEGLETARVEDIAAKAGVAVGTVYNYFGDRRALRDALLESRRESLLARVDEVVDEAAEAPFRDALDAFIRTVLEHFEKHGAVFQLLLEEEIARYRPGTARRSTMRELVARAEKLCRRGVTDRVLRGDDAEIMPTMLMSQVRGAVRYAMRTHPPGPVAEHAPRIARFFLEGAALPKHR